jgi:CO/xanthine dehydrogenase Mo-binding subunit
MRFSCTITEADVALFVGMTAAARMAIANALYDATGVRLHQIPMTPACVMEKL